MRLLPANLPFYIWFHYLGSSFFSTSQLDVNKYADYVAEAEKSKPLVFFLEISESSLDELPNSS